MVSVDGKRRCCGRGLVQNSPSSDYAIGNSRSAHPLIRPPAQFTRQVVSPMLIAGASGAYAQSDRSSREPPPDEPLTVFSSLKCGFHRSADQLQARGGCARSSYFIMLCLMLIVGGDSAQTQVSRFNFERPFGVGIMRGWTALGWELTSAPTRDYIEKTGVNFAHSGERMFFFEADNKGERAGDIFELLYDGSACESASSARITFWYSMYGSAMSTLQLRMPSSHIVWSRTGNQGDGWFPAEVHIPSVSFAFEALLGIGFKSDMAIDDVSLECGVFAPPPFPRSC